MNLYKRKKTVIKFLPLLKKSCWIRVGLKELPVSFLVCQVRFSFILKAIFGRALFGSRLYATGSEEPEPEQSENVASLGS